MDLQSYLTWPFLCSSGFLGQKRALYTYTIFVIFAFFVHIQVERIRKGQTALLQAFGSPESHLCSPSKLHPPILANSVWNPSSSILCLGLGPQHTDFSLKTNKQPCSFHTHKKPFAPPLREERMLSSFFLF